MWYWIYRIIAALLAMIGGAMLTLLAQAIRTQAHEITIALGQAVMVALFIVASSTLTACVMILLSPASRRSLR